MKSLDLRNPDDCRWYCENFEVPGKGKVGFVEFEGGRRVEFHNMTDEDAVTIANELYQIQLEGTSRQKKRIVGEGGLVQ